MFRLLHRGYRTTSALAEWSRRRVTAGGWAAFALACLVVGGGSSLEQSIGSRVGLMLAALGAIAVASLPFFRGRFSAIRSLPRCVSVGEPVRYPVHVQNHSRHRLAGLELIELPADTRLGLAEFKARMKPTRRTGHFRVSRSRPLGRAARFANVPLPTLAPGESATATVEMTPLRRGVLRLEGLLLSRTDPFGLLRSVIRLPLQDRVVVLPRRHPVPAIRMPGTPHPQTLGAALATRPGDSDEFLGLRDYRPGDPLRRIHWRAWARTGQPITREYQEEQFTRHALVLDTFSDPDNSEAFEEAVSIAASFAAQERPDGSLLDLMFVGDRSYRVASDRGPGGGGPLLEILAGVGLTLDRPVDTLFQKVLEHLGELSGIVCVLIEWDAPRKEFVRRIVRDRIPIRVFLVLGPGEKDPDLGTDPELAPAVTLLHCGRVREELGRIGAVTGGASA